MKNKSKQSDEILKKRVFFKQDHIREEFFLKIKDKFKTWTKTGKQFKIYKSRLENFRTGKLSLPEQQFFSFCKILTPADKKYFFENIILKDENWGRIKGGQQNYKKHKELFAKGRKKAWANLEKKANFNTKLTSELCELIGSIIGDGYINNYGSHNILQITGDSRLDKDYYTNTLVPIIKKISPESNPRIKKFDNTLRLTVYSKGLYILFRDRFKIQNGKKTYVVVIPDEILNSKNYKLINSCIRGIFDTDGCVAFDKRTKYKEPYIRIILKMKSIKLIKQIHQILNAQKINSTLTKNKEVIQINGKEECMKFIALIGFSNPRHLNKIKYLF